MALHIFLVHLMKVEKVEIDCGHVTCSPMQLYGRVCSALPCPTHLHACLQNHTLWLYMARADVLLPDCWTATVPYLVFDPTSKSHAPEYATGSLHRTYGMLIPQIYDALCRLPQGCL